MRAGAGSWANVVAWGMAEHPDPLAELRDELRRFVAEREWARFHDPKNLAMLLASEAGELLALLRWVDNREADAFAAQDPQRGQIAAEVADVGIALLLLTDRMGLDLVATIRDKLEVNRRNYPVEQSRGTSERPPR
jgi:NTP pyrophosphatase (non-canonical NTP hydrolase)